MAIVKKMEILDEKVNVGLWLVDIASNSFSSAGQMVSNMLTSFSSLLAAVYQELANYIWTWVGRTFTS